MNRMKNNSGPLLSIHTDVGAMAPAKSDCSRAVNKMFFQGSSHQRPVPAIQLLRALNYFLLTYLT